MQEKCFTQVNLINKRLIHRLWIKFLLHMSSSFTKLGNLWIYSLWRLFIRFSWRLKSILMSIKRSPFETGIVFKTISKQRSIHSVYFYYVMSVKDIKFILAVWLVFVFFLEKNASLPELSVLVFSLSPKLIRGYLSKIWQKYGI